MGVKLKYFLRPGYGAPAPAKDIMTALQTQDIAEQERKDAAERSKRNLEAQNQLLAQLQEQAAGQGPSLAEAQLKSASERGLASQLAAAAASRGGSQAALQRGLMNQQGDARRQLAQDAAAARIQEQQNARAQLGGLISGEQNLSDTLTKGYTGDIAQISQAEQDRRIRQQQLDQSAAAAKNANRSNLLGGISGAVGAIGHLFSDKATKIVPGGSYSDKKSKKAMVYSSEETKKAPKSSKFLDMMESLGKSSNKMASDSSGTSAEKSDLQRGQALGESAIGSLGSIANIFKKKIEQANPLETEFNALDANGNNPLENQFNALDANGNSPQYAANIQSLNAMPQLSLTSDENAKKASNDNITMSKKDFMAEHIKLLNALQHPTNKKLSKEIAEQSSEMKKYSDEDTKKPVRNLSSVKAQKMQEGATQSIEDTMKSDFDTENARKEIKNLFNWSDEKTKRGGASDDVESKQNLDSSKVKVQKFLDAIKPIAYEYKSEYQRKPNDQGEQLGIIAQDLEKAGPAGQRMIQEDANGTKMVDFGKGFGTILAAQAQLNERLKEIESKWKKKA